jgi:hypothetical protein
LYQKSVELEIRMTRGTGRFVTCMFVKDKSAFFKFSPEEEKEQGIGYLLFEIFKIRRHTQSMC